MLNVPILIAFIRVCIHFTEHSTNILPEIRDQLSLWINTTVDI